MILRSLFLASAVAFGLSAAVSSAEPTPFDLTGPVLRASVTHHGTTLPLSQVPNLTVGDRVRITTDLPSHPGARYRLVLAFLRGATNPPPKDWLIDAETWKPKRAVIDAAVPQGAEEAIVLLVPETGGAVDAVLAAVRGRPGAFVRTSQELNQAMLDRARLESFLEHIRQRDAEDVAKVSPQLAQSLAVKLDPACLLRQSEARAACLTGGSNAAVLADSQTDSIAQTLAGAPADIAMDLSSTPKAGFGYYSPYIGLVRDLARVLGAFQSAQLQFIPALGVQSGDTTKLLLNVVPSFRKPQSVLVAALPPVAEPTPPPLKKATEGALCASQPDLILPVTGAPLVFATDYARQTALRVRTKDGGTIDLPATADPVRGGYVVSTSGAAAAGLPPLTEGRLHGLWGFTPFDGPAFRLLTPAGREWQVADAASLVVGRDTPLMLIGGAAACVADVFVERGAARAPVAWAAAGDDKVKLKVPLTGAEPGPVTIEVRSYGVNQPQRIELRTYAEVGRLTGFLLRAGDREGLLTGTRLDQVATLDLGGVIFRPEALGRVASADQLTMVTDTAAVAELGPGQTRQAKVTLADGRSVGLKVTIASARPMAVLVSRSTTPIGPPPPVPIVLEGTDLVPNNARLAFSLNAQGATRFAPGDQVEVEARETGLKASLPLRLQDARIGLAQLDPARDLGDSAYGPLQFRVVHDGVAGAWQPLGTLVRLPGLTAIDCLPGAPSCVASGTGLFLLRGVAAGQGNGNGVSVPDGFTGATLTVPRPVDHRLTLTLRDAPGATATVTTAD